MSCVYEQKITRCHIGRSKGVNDRKKKTVAAFHLAASVSGLWYCACWLAVTVMLTGNRMESLLLLETHVLFLLRTSQNACSEQAYLFKRAMGRTGFQYVRDTTPLGDSILSIGAYCECYK